LTDHEGLPQQDTVSWQFFTTPFESVVAFSGELSMTSIFPILWCADVG
jgi:hypothetical protein